MSCDHRTVPEVWNKNIKTEVWIIFMSIDSIVINILLYVSKENI